MEQRSQKNQEFLLSKNNNSNSIKKARKRHQGSQSTGTINQANTTFLSPAVAFPPVTPLLLQVLDLRWETNSAGVRLSHRSRRQPTACQIQTPGPPGPGFVTWTSYSGFQSRLLEGFHGVQHRNHVTHRHLAELPGATQKLHGN